MHNLGITVALLHDIGKIAVYRLNEDLPVIHPKYYQSGHTVEGLKIVWGAIAAIPNFPDALAAEIEHAILSHMGPHGEIPPKTAVAKLLHYLDQLDCHLRSEDSREWETIYEEEEE